MVNNHLTVAVVILKLVLLEYCSVHWTLTMWLQSISDCNMRMLQLKEGALSCNWRIEKGIRVVPFKRHNHHQLCRKILLLCKFFFSSTPEEVYPITCTKMAGGMNFSQPPLKMQWWGLCHCAEDVPQKEYNNNNNGGLSSYELKHNIV